MPDYTLSSYVLITPARNEAQFIEMTIKSVIAQTVRPIKWVIVSDGSTDSTDDIVRKYMADHPWIQLLRMPERRERHFAGKVTAFNAGWESVGHLHYDVIGSLDADISFEEDCFEYLLTKFAENPGLGVAGPPFTEGNRTYDFRFSSIEHVSGACQLFRRQCFEAIGGYVPIKGGGIDLVAVVTSRMKGWQTRSFPERVCIHHRKMGSSIHQGMMVPYKLGQKDYRLGGHPLWQLFRCFYQMMSRPYIVGGFLCLMGYYVALVARRPRAVSPEFARFRGKEQMERLKSFLVGKFSKGKRGVSSVCQLTPPARSGASAGVSEHHG
jgi:poly-beta-1,6-N-acetyl-D-glucosamine synthase